ncbi:uncharacterized protein LOC143355000 [Halictus rubicundus]|uniref:uncharacterized protein LOC143355000 n=1 Tax=Halictus rubicundus TaxID=77578 RepID=UPI004036FA61
MYEDTEDASASASAFSSDTDTKDFFNALALLHSTDEDSADKLRKMLDASIEKKLGFDRTLRARVPKRYYRNTKSRGNGTVLLSTDKSEKQDGTLRKNDNAPKRLTSVPPLVNNMVKNDWGRMRIFDGQADIELNGKPMKTLDNTTKNNYKLFESFDEEDIEVDEDSSERGDIPRISIPDEGSGDGQFCKVCNGTKLGPLILLECQDCQEAYHPLCHQPPVVDVDVYDPRIVWHCNNCIDAVSTNHEPISNEARTKKFYRRGDTSKTKESSVNVDKFIKTKESLSQNDSTTFEKTLSDTVRETDGSISNNNQAILYSKDSSPLLIQKTNSLSSNQFKKRIGSKLSVARTVTKQSMLYLFMFMIFDTFKEVTIANYPFISPESTPDPCFPSFVLCVRVNRVQLPSAATPKFSSGVIYSITFVSIDRAYKKERIKCAPEMVEDYRLMQVAVSIQFVPRVHILDTQ